AGRRPPRAGRVDLGHGRLGVPARLPGFLQPGREGPGLRRWHPTSDQTLPPSRRRVLAVFKRLFWLCVGVGLGFGLSYWLARFLRQTAERYSPERVSNDVADGLRRLGADVRAAVAEGREAMREREGELRAELDARLATR